MAQRTAFLNSDAKWYNKDFHHTWIHNYLIKQPWVFFSNYQTKPEFALGNWQIAWGKAIIRCTRTTGTFAGEEILACFESTATESISTSWNKKVFIEIPQVYVNDSTAITDTLTWWANLWVWRIVSDSDYPSHTNYIPLWEISNGDWQNATDVRPEVLRRGKPNTISYFGWNWEEERIDIDNSSLNKYLMSNWAWVAPSWEEGGGGWGWSWENFKRTFTADENLLAKSMFWIVARPTLTDVDDYMDFWTTTVQNVFFSAYLNWEDFNALTLNLAWYNSPADSLSVRIETLDANGKPSWTLVDVWAYWTVTLSSATLSDVTINLADTVSWLAPHTKVAVVLSRTGSYSDSNCYRLWILKSVNRITQLYVSYEGSYSSISFSWCVACDWFSTEAVVQATGINWITPIWYSETGAIAGNDFTWIIEWTFAYDTANVWDIMYLSNTWVLTTDTSTWIIVADWFNKWLLKLRTGTTINWKGWDVKLKTINWKSIVWIWDISVSWWKYDAIVAADWTWDYLTVPAALTAWKHKIYVKNWTYNHVNERRKANTSAWVDILIEGESRKGVVVNFSSNTNTSSSARYFIQARVGDSYWSFLVRNMTFNVTPAWGTAGQSWPYNSLFYSSSSPSNQNTFRVENCNIIFDTTQGWACLSDWINMSWSYDKPSNGFFNCYIATTTGSTYAVWLTRQPYYDSWSSYGCAFEKCYIRVFGSALMWFRNWRFTECYINANDAWIQYLKLYDSYMRCDNIFAWTEAQSTWWEDYTRVDIGEVKFSALHASTTINPADRVNLWDCIWSSISISASTNALKVYQDWDWVCSYISVDDDTESMRIQGESYWCEIDCNAIDMFGSVRMSWCNIWYSTSWVHTQSNWQCNITWSRILWDWTFLWEDYWSWHWCAITWNICAWSGQDITLDWECIVFTWNASNNLKLILWDNAYKCTVSWNNVNRFETKSDSNYCVIVWNMFSSSQHSQWINNTYYWNSN